MYRETSEVSPVLAKVGLLRFDSAPRTHTHHTHTATNLTSACREAGRLEARRWLDLHKKYM